LCNRLLRQALGFALLVLILLTTLLSLAVVEVVQEQLPHLVVVAGLLVGLLQALLLPLSRALFTMLLLERVAQGVLLPQAPVYQVAIQYLALLLLTVGVTAVVAEVLLVLMVALVGAVAVVVERVVQAG
jgi:hypothetical protein